MSESSVKVKFVLHKGALIVVFALLLLLATPLECRAYDKSAEAMGEPRVEKILDDFSAILPEEHKESGDIQGAIDSLGVRRILESVIGAIKGEGTELITFILTLIGVALLGSLAALSESELGSFASRAIGVICSALLFDRLLFLLQGTVKSLGEISDFFEAVIPVCLAVNSLGISPTTASTQALGMGVTLAIYSYVSSVLVLPLVSAIFVTSAASGVDGLFARISKGIKGVFLWVMGILSALVGATFSLQSVISSSADSAVFRGAKYAISSTVPIVGAAVSGALGVITSGAVYARGAVGGGAVAVVISMMLSPLISLLMYRACLRLGVLFSEVTSSGGAAGVLSAFVGALDALIGAYALISTVYILELIAFLKGGVGVA